MSFGLADLIAMSVIEDGLRRLRENPTHLEWILNKYCEVPDLAKRIDGSYISNAIKFVSTVKLDVRPYYILDQDVYPQVVIASSYTENSKFLGDHAGYAYSQELSKAICYATFDAVEINKDTIKVSNSYKLYDKLKIGLTVTNGTDSAKILGIIVGLDTGLTTLCLDRELDDGIVMKGWKSEQPALPKGLTINSSHDSVTIQAKLTTSGDPDLHRIMALVVRYALKAGRKLFANYGIYETVMSQTPPTVSEPQDMIMETVFTVEGISVDTWVENEFEQATSIETDVSLASTIGIGKSKVKL